MRAFDTIDREYHDVGESRWLAEWNESHDDLPEDWDPTTGQRSETFRDHRSATEFATRLLSESKNLTWHFVTVQRQRFDKDFIDRGALYGIWNDEGEPEEIETTEEARRP